MATGRLMTMIIRSDVYDGGGYRISDSVSRLGVAGRYRVRLINHLDGRLIRECWSSADGGYAFNWIAYRARGYCIVAHDHTPGDQRNAAIADLVTPEPMP